MVTKTFTRTTDDIDGRSDAETVRFGLWGASYEIDLSEEHQKQLEAALAPFLDKARRAGTLTALRRNVSSGASAGYDPKAVRAWANSRGIEVSKRGRIPRGVLEQYRAAGN